MRALVVCLWVAGCSWGEQTVDGVFSAAEWDYLQSYRRELLPDITCKDDRCLALAKFGQKLFFDSRYAGPLKPMSCEPLGESKVACTHCHDPETFFIDKRPDNAQSFGAVQWTKRNAPGLVDSGFRTTFTWDDQFQVIDDVLKLAIEKPLSTTIDCFGAFVATAYSNEIFELFPGAFGSNEQVFRNAATAIGTYERQLVAGPSPFDRYLTGEVDAIDASAKRGAQLFIGKALCSECHSGPMFTDDKFHVTGVEKRYAHPPMMDDDSGRGGTGQYRTPTLRHVAMTGPYMHAGQLQTLGDVVDFYRWGGHPGGFVGQKDPRMVPLEIDDDDAHDLEAFLMTLTGGPVDPQWTAP